MLYQYSNDNRHVEALSALGLRSEANGTSRRRGGDIARTNGNERARHAVRPTTLAAVLRALVCPWRIAHRAALPLVHLYVPAILVWLAALPSTVVDGQESWPEAGLNRLVSSDQDPQRAPLLSVDHLRQFRFLINGQEVIVPAERCVYWGAAADPRSQPRLILSDGSILVADVVRVTSEDVEVDSRLFGPVTFSRAAVAAIVIRPKRLGPWHSGAPDEQAASPAASGAIGRVRLASGDSITAEVLGMEGGRLRLRIRQQEWQIPMDEVTEITLGARLSELTAQHADTLLVGLRDGSLVRVREARIGQSECRLALDAGPTLFGLDHLHPIRDELLVYLRPARDSTDSVRSLLDLALNHHQQSLLDVTWPMARNANVWGGPMRVGGRHFPIGLGVHSAARITVEVPEGAEWFAAEVALDDSAGVEGSVTFRVFTYSPEQGWQQRAAAGPLERGTGPVALRVPLQHATRLALAVDPADAWDVRDFANWIEPRLVFSYASEAADPPGQ